MMVCLTFNVVYKKYKGSNNPKSFEEDTNIKLMSLKDAKPSHTHYRNGTIQKCNKDNTMCQLRTEVLLRMRLASVDYSYLMSLSSMSPPLVLLLSL